MLNTSHQEKVESAFRKAVYSDRARVQIASISKFGLLEVSRQRLRPSLNESYDIEHVLVRGPRSLGQSILRIIGEDSAKDNTGEIQVYVPSDVASYLLNEKRYDIINIEKSNNIRVMIIADPYKARPYYKVVRIKSTDMKDEDSYKLTPNSPEANIDWRDDKNRSKGMKPLVDGIKPPKMPKKKKEGLLGWIKSIAGIETVEKPKPRPSRSNNNNNNRNRTRKPRPQNQNRNPNQKKAPNQSNQVKNPNQNKAPVNKTETAKPVNTKPSNTKPLNSTTKASKEVDGNIAPTKAVKKPVKSESKNGSIKKTAENKSEQVIRKPAPTPAPNKEREPAIREIVREPKMKKEIPTKASNDPRYKS